MDLNKQQSTAQDLLQIKKREYIVGLHILGTDAFKVVQGFSVPLSEGMTKDELDKLIGLKYTLAEVTFFLNYFQLLFYIPFVRNIS